MRFETVPHIGNTLTFSGTGNVKTVTEVNFDSDVSRNPVQIKFIREKNDIVNSYLQT